MVPPFVMPALFYFQEAYNCTERNEEEFVDKMVMYYWGPCPTCAIATKFADEHGIALDLRDVEQVDPYNELLALGGDANKIPYLYDGAQLVEGIDAVMDRLKALA